jgi:hypothetical protein
MNILQIGSAALMINLAGSQWAVAADWVYCIAPANQDRALYVTEPFLTGATGSALEGFHDFLNRSGLRHDTVQCPTGTDEATVRDMRRYAAEFNQRRGIKVIPVDWRPSILR